jgi:rod shape-determining protein MreD
VEGAFTAFALGYLFDALTGRPTGLYAFLAVLVFLVVRVANGVIDARTRGLYALATGAATLGTGLLAAFFTWLTSRDGGQAAGLKGLPWQVLFTFLAALLMWPLLRKVNPGQERPEPGVLRA